MDVTRQHHIKQINPNSKSKISHFSMLCGIYIKIKRREYETVNDLGGGGRERQWWGWYYNKIYKVSRNWESVLFCLFCLSKHLSLYFSPYWVIISLDRGLLETPTFTLLQIKKNCTKKYLSTEDGIVDSLHPCREGESLTCLERTNFKNHVERNSFNWAQLGAFASERFNNEWMDVVWSDIKCNLNPTLIGRWETGIQCILSLNFSLRWNLNQKG